LQGSESIHEMMNKNKKLYIEMKILCLNYSQAIIDFASQVLDLHPLSFLLFFGFNFKIPKEFFEFLGV